MAEHNILVTGGAGYIGSHVVLELLRSGYTPIILDNFSNSKTAVVTRLEQLSGTQITCIHGDCRDESTLNHIFTNYRFSAIMLFAGLKSVSESISKPLEYYDHNVSSLVTTLKVAHKNKVKKIVFSSSATVYAPGGDEHISEVAALGPINPYGQSKLMCEQIIEDFAKSSRTISAAIMRYFNPIGAHPSGQIGESPNQPPNNLMPIIDQVAVGRLPELIIYGDDYNTHDGTGIRDYIHVADLARGHVQALEFMTTSIGAHHFNLGTGKGTSVLELIKIYEQANACSIPYRIGSRRPGDLGIVVADPTKAYEQIGFTCTHTPIDACRHAWNWQSKNPAGYEET